MINSLTYSVTFPTTGRAFDESIQFQKGFGAIIGPNEAGKSLIIEMIRWCLFGTAALRGTASDYKDLKGELNFDLKGENYTIKRTINSAKLYRGKDEIANGVRPVNNKIVQLLGFGLDVFDMSCVANQDELIRLGAMKPAERKRMVDSVIGLGVLEDLAKNAGDEAKSLAQRAEDLLEAVKEPVEPQKPADYLPSEQIEEKRKRLLEARSEHDQIEGWLSVEPQAPVPPEETVPLDSESIRSLLASQSEIKAQRQALNAQLANLPEPSIYSEDQLAAFERQANLHSQAMQKARFLNQYEEPKYTLDQLAKIEVHGEAWKVECERRRLMERIEHLKGCGTNECPNCGHEWPVEQDQIEVLERELEALLDVANCYTCPPFLDEQQIAAERRKIEIWLSVQDQWEKLRDYPDEAEKPQMSLEEIETHRRANAAAAQRAEITAKIEELDQILSKQPDYADMLAKRQLYEERLARYQEEVRRYVDWQAERKEKEARLHQLKQQLVELPVINDLYERCRLYEHQLAAYQDAKKQYDEIVETATGFKKESEEWKKVKTALNNLRGLVKQHLVPSLNKVASHLITQMTGGQRQKIEVDEDFNILVDDQSIDTLSGSGKAVANLALRLGLGQVLTNNVLSLFMGDEIDASMDKDRAENTTNTLQTLRRKISQIVLVTHKYPLADYYVSLGERHEANEQ